MNYLAAAMLIALAGKTPDEESIKKVLREAGTKADDGKIKKFIEQIKGKDVFKLAKEGISKLGAGGASSAPAKAEKPAEAKKEDKKPAKKEEPKKEEPPAEEDAGGFGDLFG
jgi:ribosomal protein L12E/L44/L45/RPP1/RPP2